MEKNSKEIDFLSTTQILRFLFQHWDLYLIVNTAFFAFMIEIWFYINGPNAKVDLNSGTLLSGTGNSLLYSMMVLPLFMIFYFVTIFVLKDSGIKIRSVSKDNKVDWFVFFSNSPKSLINLVVGLSAIL